MLTLACGAVLTAQTAIGRGDAVLIRDNENRLTVKTVLLHRR